MDWTPETIGPWLREMRERAGFSLDALGERVGRTRQQLIDYEKGRRDATGSTLMRILTELGVRIEAPVAAPAVGSIVDELERFKSTLDALRAAVESQGPGAAATAQAVELVRRQRNGEAVDPADLERVADAMAAARLEHEGLEGDLREAARAARSAP